MQGPERVDHHGGLVGGGLALGKAGHRRLDRAGLRAVREPGRMQGDRAHAYPGALAGGVVASDVEHHLVRVHVVMVVGDRHRLGVEIEWARAERADDEVRPLEGLVHRRRRMGPLQHRLEVGDVERVGVQAPVPAHDVERVMAVVVGGDPIG